MMTPSQVEKTYELITSYRELKSVADVLQQQEVIGVDMEADSMFRFKERVCLLQVSAGDVVFLIDPMKLETLEPLNPIFSDPAIRKVMHGADYDIRSLYRDFGIEVSNLFDTELACRFLGAKETGLEATLMEWFHIRLEKKYQKKDWSQRPLPEAMLDYATRDVMYLPQLSEKIRCALEKCGRLEWVQEECDLLSKVRPASSDGLPLFSRVPGAGRLHFRSLGVLEALLQYRLKVAEKKDRPVFKVMSNRILVEMAKFQPGNFDQLAALNLLSTKQLHMHAAALLEIIQQAQKIPPDQLPRYPRPQNRLPKTAAPQRLLLLRQWRDNRAKRLGLDPAMLLNKNMLMTIAVKKPLEMEEFEKIEGLRKWQVREFGEEVRRVLRGEK
ncbi:MAG: ribonuclease D [Thermodesulfobacteriota bacterium]